MHFLRKIPGPILAYLLLLGAVGGLITWMAATGNVPTIPGFGGGNTESENVYVVYFAEDSTLEERKALLTKVPGAKFLQDGILPGVTVVEIRTDLTRTLAALQELPRVEMVLKVTPLMICH